MPILFNKSKKKEEEKKIVETRVDEELGLFMQNLSKLVQY